MITKRDWGEFVRNVDRLLYSGNGVELWIHGEQIDRTKNDVICCKPKGDFYHPQIREQVTVYKHPDSLTDHKSMNDLYRTVKIHGTMSMLLNRLLRK
jgi:hypothetical protein